MTHRREITVAVTLCTVGAALVLLAAESDWVRYAAPAGRTATRVQGEAAPLTRALGLAALAGVVGIAAARRAGRVAVGVVLVLVGVAVVVVAAGAALDAAPQAATRGVLPATDPRSTGWPWIAAFGGVLAAAAGALVAARGPRWSAMSQRYASTGSGGTTPEAGETGMWDALSRGDDPT